MNFPKRIRIDEKTPSSTESAAPESSDELESTMPIRKFTAQVQPGKTEYRIRHNLRTTDVVVQTRIAGRIREGGVSIIDENTVQLTFGGTLNETMDVVVIG